MSPSDEAWRAQDTGKQIEPLRVVGQVLLEVTVPHLPQIIRGEQAGVGGVWIQSHIHCRETEGGGGMQSAEHQESPFKNTQLFSYFLRKVRTLQQRPTHLTLEYIVKITT